MGDQVGVVNSNQMKQCSLSNHAALRKGKVKSLGSYVNKKSESVGMASFPRDEHCGSKGCSPNETSSCLQWDLIACYTMCLVRTGWTCRTGCRTCFGRSKMKLPTSLKSLNTVSFDMRACCFWHQLIGFFFLVFHNTLSTVVGRQCGLIVMVTNPVICQLCCWHACWLFFNISTLFF